MTHTTNPAIPADINDLQSIAGTLSDMIAMASQAHNQCDINSETDRFAGLLLLGELRDAYEILEDYHDKCSEELEKTIDYDASETEHCSSFQETYGKDFDRLTCHEHDKLRRWAKLLVTAREAFSFARGQATEEVSD